MKKFLLYLLFLNFVFKTVGIASGISPTKFDYDQVINIGEMQSHNKEFTLFFKTREKAILAKGIEFNYINDYPQDLYYLDNNTGKIYPLITYDWFPKKIRELGASHDLPIFPEDFAYYLLSDNETLVMISGIKSIKSNYQFNLKNKNLEPLSKKEKYNLRFVFSLLKNCGFRDLNSKYKCTFYKPLISENLIK